MTVTYFIIAALVVVAIYFGIRYFVRASQQFSGERVIKRFIASTRTWLSNAR